MGTKSLEPNTPLSLRLHFTLPIFLGSGVPDDYLILFSGNIIRHDEQDREIDIGEVQVFLAQLGAAREAGLLAYDTLDAERETAEYLVLLDKDDEWREDLQKRFEIYSDDLLILNRIKIKEAYRGRGFALLALRQIIDVFARSCGLIACFPLPPGYEGKEGIADVARFRKDQAALRRYWQRLGFQRVPKTNLLVMSTALKMPSMETVLRGIDVNKW